MEVDHAVWQEKSTTDYRYLCGFLDAMDLVWDAVDADMERQLAELFADVPAPDGTKRRTPFDLKSTLNAMMPYAVQLCERCRLDTWADWSLHWIRTETALAACTESPRLMAKILLGPSPALQGLLRNTFTRDGRHAYDSMGYLRHTAQLFLSR